MRRASDRVRIRLGDYWLQGENGWGPLECADVLTRAEAQARLARLHGVRCEVVPIDGQSPSS